MYSVVEQSWCVRGFQGGWYVGKALYKMTSKIVGLFHMYFLQPVIVLPLPLFFFFLDILAVNVCISVDEGLQKHISVNVSVVFLVKTNSG